MKPFSLMISLLFTVTQARAHELGTFRKVGTTYQVYYSETQNLKPTKSLVIKSSDFVEIRSQNYPSDHWTQIESKFGPYRILRYDFKKGRYQHLLVEQQLKKGKIQFIFTLKKDYRLTALAYRKELRYFDKGNDQCTRLRGPTSNLLSIASSTPSCEQLQEDPETFATEISTGPEMACLKDIDSNLAENLKNKFEPSLDSQKISINCAQTNAKNSLLGEFKRNGTDQSLTLYSGFNKTDSMGRKSIFFHEMIHAADDDISEEGIKCLVADCVTLEQKCNLASLNKEDLESQVNQQWESLHKCTNGKEQEAREFYNTIMGSLVSDFDQKSQLLNFKQSLEPLLEKCTTKSDSFADDFKNTKKKICEGLARRSNKIDLCQGENPAELATKDLEMHENATSRPITLESSSPLDETQVTTVQSSQAPVAFAPAPAQSVALANAQIPVAATATTTPTTSNALATTNTIASTPTRGPASTGLEANFSNPGPMLAMVGGQVPTAQAIRNFTNDVARTFQSTTDAIAKQFAQATGSKSEPSNTTYVITKNLPEITATENPKEPTLVSFHKLARDTDSRLTNDDSSPPKISRPVLAANSPSQENQQEVAAASSRTTASTAQNPIGSRSPASFGAATAEPVNNPNNAPSAQQARAQLTKTNASSTLTFDPVSWLNKQAKPELGFAYFKRNPVYQPQFIKALIRICYPTNQPQDCVGASEENAEQKIFYTNGQWQRQTTSRQKLPPPVDDL